MYEGVGKSLTKVAHRISMSVAAKNSPYLPPPPRTCIILALYDVGWPLEPAGRSRLYEECRGLYCRIRRTLKGHEDSDPEKCSA